MSCSAVTMFFEILFTVLAGFALVCLAIALIYAIYFTHMDK